MESTLIVLAIAILAAGAVAWRRRDRVSTAGSWSAAAPPGARRAQSGRVVLDVVPDDPQDEAVQRLASALAHDELTSDHALAEVVVVDAAGEVLLTLARPTELTSIRIPEGAPELTPRRSRTPSVVDRGREARHVPPAGDGPGEPVHRDLAARYELSTRILAELADRDDPVELVRAIMVVGGHEVSVDHGAIRSGDDLVVVVGDAHGHGLSRDDLSGAFLRYRNSGARRGLIVTMGFVPRHELARRQALAPEVTYAGPTALQRMADAASLGIDPLRFAATPA